MKSTYERTAWIHGLLLIALHLKLLEQNPDVCLYGTLSNAQAQAQINALAHNSDSPSPGLTFGGYHKSLSDSSDLLSVWS